MRPFFHFSRVLKYWGLTIVLILSLVLNLNAQVESDALVLFEKGVDNYNRFHLKEASKQLNEAYSVFLEQENYAYASKSLSYLSGTFWRLRKYDSAKLLVEKSLRIIENNDFAYKPEATALAKNFLGIVLRDLGYYKEAKVALLESLDIFLKVDNSDSLEVAGIYNDLGVLSHHAGENFKSIYYYKKALRLQERTQSRSPKRINELQISLLNLSFSYQRFKLYNKAIIYLKSAENLGEFSSEVLNSTVYRRLSSLYLHQGFSKKALESMNNFLYRSDNKTPPSRTFEYLHAANLFCKTGQRDSSIYYLNESINQTQFIQSWHIIPTCLAIGEISQELGLLEQSELYYKKSIDFNGDNINNPSTLFTIRALNSLAGLHNNDQSLALKEYDQAIALNISDVESPETNERQNFRQVNHSYELLVSLLGKAEVLQNIYEEDTDLDHLHSALSIYKNAHSVITSIRGRVDLYLDQLLLSKYVPNLYDPAISLSLRLYDITNDSIYLRTALQFSELGRSQILKNYYGQSNLVIPKGNIVDSLSQTEQIFEKTSYYKSLLYTSELDGASFSQEEVDRIETKLYELDKEYSKLKPQQVNFHYDNEFDSGMDLAELNSRIGPDESFIEYYVSERSVYAFILNSDTLIYYRLSVDEATLTQDINALRHSILQKDLMKYKANAVKLYDQLLKPFKGHLDGENLIISPHGVLWHLNFDLLLSNHGAETNPKEFAYLAKDYTVRYINSAELLMKKYQSKPLLKEVLAFSFMDSSQVGLGGSMSLLSLRDSKVDLPGSRKEITDIAKIVDGSYYYGSESNELNFKSEAGKYAVLHLAVHGKADENPEVSRLYFSATNDSTEDNRLHGFEISNLNLPADLAILSACNTGDGVIAKGEGILSLGSAFQYAGVKSLVLSSWEVSDDAAPDLMKHFYTNLKAGMNKAEALRQAKLTFLEEAPQALADPFYWGNFYLIGDNSLVEFEEDNDFVVVWLFLGLLILLAIWWQRKVFKRIGF